MNIVKILILSTFFSSITAYSNGPEKVKSLTATYGADYVKPFILKDANGKIVGGFIPELYKLLENETNLKIKLHSAPKNRESTLIEEGVTDFTCYTSVPWTKNPERFLWTNELFFQATNRVYYSVSRFRSKPKTLKDLQSKTIGVILGYKYGKQIEEKLNSGEIKKIEFRNFDLMFRSLIAGRVDSIIDTGIQYTYLKNHLKTKNIEASDIKLNTYEVSCQISKKKPELLKAFNKAIKSLRTNGKLKALLEKYGQA